MAASKWAYMAFMIILSLGISSAYRVPPTAPSTTTPTTETRHADKPDSQEPNGVWSWGAGIGLTPGGSSVDASGNGQGSSGVWGSIGGQINFPGIGGGSCNGCGGGGGGGGGGGITIPGLGPLYCVPASCYNNGHGSNCNANNAIGIGFWSAQSKMSTDGGINTENGGPEGSSNTSPHETNGKVSSANNNGAHGDNSALGQLLEQPVSTGP
ncbi:uncharacterized protein LOC132281527 [Cornus florida]|uniref:uncharacterized protein LOC132281527 n=1 Tax=Cornus florida TaxID=4283 RepID=UPI0028970C4F|nr:uncharacterized protein LOC132281527 [Cornus florida]